MTNSSVHACAEFVSTASLPDAVKTVLHPAFIDNLGCILGGKNAPAIRKISTAFPPPRPYSYQALIMAASGHAFDFDDWEDPGNSHASVVILPALIAATDLKFDRGLNTSGQDLMAAYGIGLELTMRLGEIMTLDHYQRGFHATATLAAIGAAAAVSRLLSLDSEQTAHALGIATSQAIGYTMQFGSETKLLQAGFAARCGIDAAILAAQGITSKPETVFDDRGFAGLLGAIDQEKRETLPHVLGHDWAIEKHGLVLKPWPSCGYTHRMMTAAMQLRDHVVTRLDDISEITLKTVDFHYKILAYDQPETLAQALFSLPACTMQALCYGGLSLDDCQSDFWQDPVIHGLIQKCKIIAEPALDPDQNYHPDQPDQMTITMASGEVLNAAIAYPIGAPQSPMSVGQIKDKFLGQTHLNDTLYDQIFTWPDHDNLYTLITDFGIREI